MATTRNRLKQVAQLYGTEREPNPQAGRVYDADGISPTLDTCSGGNRMPKILVRQATKSGYTEICRGGGTLNCLPLKQDKERKSD